MPNWCFNELAVSGPTERLDELMAVIGDGSSFLSAFLPTPPELLQHPSPLRDVVLASKFRRRYGEEDWYEWNCANWGTKWDVNLEGMHHDTDSAGAEARLSCTFDSAWSPPLEAFDTIASRYPDLRFDLFFDEPGMGFSGDATWVGGVRMRLEEGPAMKWCDVCGRRQRVDKEVEFPPGEDATTCTDCIPDDHQLVADVPRLF